LAEVALVIAAEAAESGENRLPCAIGTMNGPL
jgi:hypothetical protein